MEKTLQGRTPVFLVQGALSSFFLIFEFKLKFKKRLYLYSVQNLEVIKGTKLERYSTYLSASHPVPSPGGTHVPVSCVSLQRYSAQYHM